MRAAFQIVSSCGDERFWAWRAPLECETGVVDVSRKLAYLEVLEQKLEKELGREGDRRKTFCSIDCDRVEILPFCEPADVSTE